MYKFSNTDVLLQSAFSALTSPFADSMCYGHPGFQDLGEPVSLRVWPGSALGGSRTVRLQPVVLLVGHLGLVAAWFRLVCSRFGLVWPWVPQYLGFNGLTHPILSSAATPKWRPQSLAELSPNLLMGSPILYSWSGTAGAEGTCSASLNSPTTYPCSSSPVEHRQDLGCSVPTRRGQ